MLLGFVEQPEAGVHSASLRFGPGEADQQPTADLRYSGEVAGQVRSDQPEPGAQLPDGDCRAPVIAGYQGGRMHPGGPVGERHCAHVRGKTPE